MKELNDGDIVNDLKILKEVEPIQKYGHPMRMYQCECLLCGNIKVIDRKAIVSGSSTNCGCKRKNSRFREMKIGEQYGNFIVLSEPIKKGDNCFCYKCRCVLCGREKEMRGDTIRSGSSESCGCLTDKTRANNAKIAHESNWMHDTNKGSILSNKKDWDSVTGIKNVRYHKRLKKYQVSIDYRHKTYWLGTYSDIEEAKKVAEEAREARKKDFLKWYNERG